MLIIALIVSCLAAPPFVRFVILFVVKGPGLRVSVSYRSLHACSFCVSVLYCYPELCQIELLLARSRSIAQSAVHLISCQYIAVRITFYKIEP